jgi:hypothetical protein
MVGRPINKNKEMALILGERTYRGSTHACGTNERYTSGGGCVYCARLKANAQRAALVAQNAAVNDSANEPLDTAEPITYPAPWD